MKCEFCNGTTVKKPVRKHHWFNGKLYIIENVEAEVCNECGERYFYAGVLENIDQILSHEHKIKEHIDVEVVAI